MSFRQAEERSHNKSRLLNFGLYEVYTNELLVHCCIHRVMVKSEHGNCMQTRHLLTIRSHTYIRMLILACYTKFLPSLDSNKHFLPLRGPSCIRDNSILPPSSLNLHMLDAYSDWNMTKQITWKFVGQMCHYLISARHLQEDHPTVSS